MPCHQRGGEWGRRRGDPAGEGVQTALVIFLIFALQATALDMLTAIDEDVQYMYMLNVVYVLWTCIDDTL